MEDMKSRLEKLLADTAGCELIANLATDPAKRESFTRMAMQYRSMAEQLKAEIANATAQAV